MHIPDRRSSRTDLTDNSALQRPFTTPTITEARPNMCGSYSMTLAHALISPWVKGTQCSQLNCAHDLATVRSPPSTPFISVSLSLDNPTNSSSTEPYNSWEIPSSRVRYYSSDISPKNFKKLVKKSSKLVPRSDTRNKSRCWPLAPSPPLDKLWTRPSNASNRPEPTTPSTHYYFAKRFGMSVTTKQWSTRETTSIASYKREDDRHRPTYRVRILHLPISLTSWHGSTTHRCGTCMTSPSSKTEETTMGVMSEVAVFTP